jgi:hypothetical protein
MPRPYHRSTFDLQILHKGESTSGLEPLTCSLRVCLSKSWPAQVRPVDWLIYSAFGVLERIWCPLRTGVYQPSCSTLADRKGCVVSTTPHLCTENKAAVAGCWPVVPHGLASRDSTPGEVDKSTTSTAVFAVETGVELGKVRGTSTHLPRIRRSRRKDRIRIRDGCCRGWLRRCPPAS